MNIFPFRNYKISVIETESLNKAEISQILISPDVCLGCTFN